MTTAASLRILAAMAFCAATGSALAQTPAPAAKAPDSLVLYFASGSTTVGKEGLATLDQASRLYRDGKPIVMVVSGSTDAVGSPAANLKLSQQRADAVLQGLIARGIPAERFQVLAKGETEPSVPTAKGVAEARNRRVEITWR